MKKTIREILSYAGYTISVYFLSHYVNNDFGTQYQFFVWLFVFSAAFFFEGDFKEVFKEIGKCSIILIGTTIIDYAYHENISSVWTVFCHQIIWQLCSVIFVLFYFRSEKLHGKYTLKYARECLIFYACLSFGLGVKFFLVLIFTGIFSLCNGVRYWYFSNMDNRLKEKELKEKQEKEKREKQYIKNVEEQNIELKKEIQKYKDKEHLLMTKKKRSIKRIKRKSSTVKG